MFARTKLWGLVAGLALMAAPVAAQNPIDEDGRVTIQNNRNEKITVYLDVRPFERRLGSVAPMSTATFDLPRLLVNENGTVKLQIQRESGMIYEAQARVMDAPPNLALMVPGEDAEDLEDLPADRVAALLAGRDLTSPTVTIRNAEDEAAEVYLISGNGSHHLGRVDPESITTFAIPAGMAMGDAEIVLAPEGEPPVVKPIPLHENAHIGLDL